MVSAFHLLQHAVKELVQLLALAFRSRKKPELARGIKPCPLRPEHLLLNAAPIFWGFPLHVWSVTVDDHNNDFRAGHLHRTIQDICYLGLVDGAQKDIHNAIRSI